MHNFDSTNTAQFAMPKVVAWLLERLANPTYKDELMGDLQEEFAQRKVNGQQATQWLLRQTALAILDGQQAMIKSTRFIKVVSLLLCALLLPSIALFVGWLSNMEQPTEHLWQLLLAGEVHSILMTGEYWSLAWNESGVAHLQPSMFINVPALGWAALFCGAAYLLFKHLKPSVWAFSVFALLFTIAPYLYGYAVISLTEPAPQTVGPILAFMMLAPFFTLPLYVFMLFKRFAN